MLGSSVHLPARQLPHVPMEERLDLRNISSRGSLDPFVNWYKCADGKWLMLNEPHSERIWEEFCSVMGLDDVCKRSAIPHAVRAGCTYAAEHSGISSSKPSAPGPDNHGPTSLLQEEGAVRIHLREYGSGIGHRPAGARQRVRGPHTAPDYGPHQDYGPARQVFQDSGYRSETLLPEFGQHTEEVLTEECGYNWD